MLWQMTRDRSQWEQTDRIIDEWLKERQELLVLFHQIAGITPFEEDIPEDEREILIRFCQTLIDYISAGHFEVFEKIAELSEARQGDHLGLDRELLVKISRTTLQALKFNDACPTQTDELKQGLSLLGEHLAQRFDLEDELIGTYLKARNATDETNADQSMKMK